MNLEHHALPCLCCSSNLGHSHLCCSSILTPRWCVVTVCQHLLSCSLPNVLSFVPGLSWWVVDHPPDDLLEGIHIHPSVLQLVLQAHHNSGLLVGVQQQDLESGLGPSFDGNRCPSVALQWGRSPLLVPGIWADSEGCPFPHQGVYQLQRGERKPMYQGRPINFLLYTLIPVTVSFPSTSVGKLHPSHG
eukprot:3049292-Rhodomonas_salina.1